MVTANAKPRFYDSVLAELAGRPGGRLLRAFYAAIDELVADKRARFHRVLPLADYLVDRWDKARMLGFGEGSSVYDSCLVIGDVEVGKNCWFGPFTVIDGSGGLRIGDGCTFSAGVQVYTHDNIARTLDGTSPIERSPTTIGQNVYVGPNAVLTRGLSIGDRVLIGANSLVTSDVPSGAKVAGNPARVIGSV
jgi:acetyltransferase-like isoleucine patch superfamily enzyme